MGEQQQETVVSKSGSSSTLFSIVAVIAVVAVIAWLGWGEEIRNAFAPKPAPALAAAAPQPAKPAEPEKPRPTVGATVSPRPLGVSKIGAFDFGGVYCLVIHYNERWNGVDQQIGFTADEGYPRKEGDVMQFKGKWSPTGVPFDWNQTVQRVDAQTLLYDLSLKSDTGVQTNALALGINLPANLYGGEQILVDGEPLKLPADPPASSAAAGIMPGRMVKTLEIATPAGRIAFDGPMQMMVQDNRAYGGDVYYIRIGFTPESGLLTDTHLKLKVRQVLDTKPSEAPPAQTEAGKPAGR